MLATGNTAVVVASQAPPAAGGRRFAEVLATSDLPGGVVNLLTGFTAELAPWLASHRDVNALDLTGAPEADRAGPRRPPRPTPSSGCFVPRDDRLGARSGPDPARAFVETKTVWHPIGV